MQQDRPRLGSAADWLSREKGDLAIARAPLPDGAFYEDFCFHIQQAAEKALKAAFQHNGWEFRYTHDLSELISGLKTHGVRVHPEVEEADVLTGFAWESRYPGLREPVTKAEHEEALKMGTQVVVWAEAEAT